MIHLRSNHSCVPNAEATFPYNNFTLVMEAIKEIQPGESPQNVLVVHRSIAIDVMPTLDLNYSVDNRYELVWIKDSELSIQNIDLEIIVCYLDECNRNRSRHSRIKLLRENYLFSCTCPKCESQINDEDITSESDADGD
ncbi:UNVERIFIED_CONTAM: smyd5 [Trichonephila clavipes]